MKIVLRSGNSAATYEIRDIVGEYGLWVPGVVRDVPDDATLTFIERHAEGDRRVTRNAVDAILSCGANFVDADTGVNPHFSCANCGDETTADFFGDPASGAPIYYRDAHGSRICVSCFLDANPQWERRHTDGGFVRPASHAAAKPSLTPAVAEVAVAASTAAAFGDESWSDHPAHDAHSEE